MANFYAVIDKITQMGIVPVIKIEDASKSVPLAHALIEGGLPCAEITFRTDAAPQAIKLITDAFPHMLVGAGTVLTTEQVDLAVTAGAAFIVSPGLNPTVVSYCIERDIPIIPGCATAGDIEQALALGLDTVKFFPAEAAGGLNMIKALSAPYSNIRFMPTGGINERNLNEYLAFPKVIACGGSFMVSDRLIAANDFDTIKSLTHNAVSNMMGFSLGHVGINAANPEEAGQIANIFSAMFGFNTYEGASGIFADNVVEVMKTPYLGEHGHIAISTNHLKRAIAYMESRGYALDSDTAKYDAKGNLTAIYFKAQVGGFAIHLSQKK